MATRAISFHTLLCDGAECEVTFGRDTYYASLVEVRAAAFGAGWRFPARRRANGKQAEQVNDVCPAHVDDWEERPAQNNWANRSRSDD